jgi:hypothetical protein
MTTFTKNIIIFLIINFAALGIGGFLMGEGPSGDINKAPWALIIVCFII